jgi:DNA topoisomerase VI subunit B
MPPDQPAALIDQEKFEKIIFNLISNAFKYTPDNGSIAVTITTVEKDAGAFVAIHVKDTGVGIPSHVKDKVFEIFYQVEGSHRFESGSSGIGLALTKELVELHGGQIEVESELGKGSDFIVYLPLDASHPVTEDQGESELHPNQQQYAGAAVQLPETAESSDSSMPELLYNCRRRRNHQTWRKPPILRNKGHCYSWWKIIRISETT